MATRLEARLDELVDAVCSAVFAEVSPYQQLALPTAVKGFRADVRGSLDAYVRTVGEGRPKPGDVERFHRLGAQRASQGLPADAVTDALEVAMRTCWHYVSEAALTIEDPRSAAELLADLALEAFAHYKDAAAALTAGHSAERGRGTYGHARAAAEVVARLVDGTWSDERELRRAVRALGFDLSSRWTLVLLTPVDPRGAHDLERLAPAVGEALPDGLVGAARVVPTSHLPVLLPGDGDEAAGSEALQQAAAVAEEHGSLLLVSDVAWLWTALPHAYRSQTEDIVCARAASRNGVVVRDSACAAYRLLRTLPLSQRVEYVRSVLGPVLDLPPGKSGEVLATLDAYFRGRGRLDETAADLRLHRNSFRYRLDRAQTLLGVNFRNGTDRMRVELALALRRLDREEMALLEAHRVVDNVGTGAGEPTVG
ncbi:MAG TPA: helix-turn-helix domain-containing protein [Acidimicrobiales bacterium]|nr:helix-turn-helix domain-containing protein [Acidimicrobiales bacterium]